MDDSVIMCDEIIYAEAKSNDKETKTIPTNFHEKNITCKIQNCYILLVFLLIAIALLMSLLNCVPYVLMCQCALCAYVPTCLKCLRACMPTCLACLRAHMPTCLACLCAYVHCVLGMPTCSRVITTNNKNKFSITCFPSMFVIVLCLFPVK